MSRGKTRALGFGLYTKMNNVTSELEGHGRKVSWLNLTFNKDLISCQHLQSTITHKNSRYSLQKSSRPRDK